VHQAVDDAEIPYEVDVSARNADGAVMRYAKNIK
jgi:hypothetical protein